MGEVYTLATNEAAAASKANGLWAALNAAEPEGAQMVSGGATKAATPFSKKRPQQPPTEATQAGNTEAPEAPGQKKKEER